MVFLKAVTFVVAGLLTLVAVRRMMGELDAAKARVNTKPSGAPRAPKRLRQDPRTGIYYPEE